MDTAFSRFRSLSIWAYVCLFGALWGYATFGSSALGHDGAAVTEQRGALAVWVALALTGSTLVGLKNHLVADRRIRGFLYMSDLAITGILLALIFITPASLGLLRGGLVLGMEVAYIAVYVNALYKGRLVERRQ